jgi:hypothetical protein
MEALKQFEATEANLLKLQRLWDELQTLFPASVSLDHDPEYEDRCRSFESVLRALPMIDGWKPDLCPPDPEGVAATRFDLMELGEPLAEAQFETALWSEGRQIREYRFRLDQKRRALIRDSLLSLMDEFEVCLRGIALPSEELEHYTELGARPAWQQLRSLATRSRSCWVAACRNRRGGPTSGVTCISAWLGTSATSSRHVAFPYDKQDSARARRG